MSPAASRSGFLYAVCLLLSSQLPAVADSLTIRYAGEMMQLPAGSDVVALGEAGVVLPRHAVSSLWNPSSPAFADRYEVSAEFADLYEGLSQQACIAMTVPFSEGLGASIVYMPFFSGAIDRQDSLSGSYQERLLDQGLRADGTPLGEFHNNQHLIVVTIGKLFSLKMPRTAPDAGLPLPLDIAVGFSFKSFWQTMNPDNLTHMGMNVNLDGGIMLRIGVDYDIAAKSVSRQVFIGAAVRDMLPSPIIWSYSRDEYDPDVEYQEEVTPSFYSGIAYVDKSGILGGNWTLCAAIRRQYGITYNYGIEGEFWDMIAFRAGLSDKTPALGAGIRYKKYFLDYSFTFNDLAWSYVRLSAGIRY